MEREEAIEKLPNSMFYWWPRVEDCGIPMPKTTLVPVDFDEYLALVVLVGDGMTSALTDAVFERVDDVASQYPRPVFIRTDHLADKHHWRNTCYIANDNYENLCNHLFKLVEEFELQTFMSGEVMLGFAVRDYIRTNPFFFAFHGGLPINKERRLFYERGKGIVCHHNYWPEDSILHPSVPDWKERLKETDDLCDLDLTNVVYFAEEVGDHLATPEHPAWSIDLMKGADGQWYFIDCATADRSYHWAGCENETRYK